MESYSLTCWMLLAIASIVRTQNLTADLHPIVDLGYARYTPTNYNSQGQYYNFTNIRYAAPPLGPLRFNAPQPPLQESPRTINDGSIGYICPQAMPDYFASAAAGTPDQGASIPALTPGLQESEDCLFLDVVVPKKIFEAGKGGKGTLAPVLVQIHGGGDFNGDKATLAWPGGLLERSRNGIVYVSMNYRLGAFGFLSNLSPSQSNLTSPNAGLLDQRMALRWIQTHIHLFGGNSTAINLIGESAGGTNIAFHTTAHGGSNPSDQLFQRTIIQSAVINAADPALASRGSNLFLQTLGVNSVDEARRLPTASLQRANKLANKPIPNSATFFGPSIDGDLVPDHPARLFKAGRFFKNIEIMTSSNRNEGLLISDKSVTSDEGYSNWVRAYFPSAPRSFHNEIIKTYYPPDYSGAQGYTDAQTRLQKTITELLFACSTYTFAAAFAGKTFNMLFDIPPAYHAMDLAYTFYPLGEVKGLVPEVARTLQGYYTNFVMTGRPGMGVRGGVEWPAYGVQGKGVDATAHGVRVATTEYMNERCRYISGAPFAARGLGSEGSGSGVEDGAVEVVS